MSLKKIDEHQVHLYLVGHEYESLLTKVFSSVGLFTGDRDGGHGVGTMGQRLSLFRASRGLLRPGVEDTSPGTDCIRTIDPGTLTIIAVPIAASSPLRG